MKYNEGIIVLTSGMKENSRLIAGWKPDLEGHIRLAAAAHLYHQNISKGKKSYIIISGGKVYGEENPCLADVMKETAVRKYKIPEADIYSEDKSTDTTENAEFSIRLIESNNLGKKPAIITNGFHLGRALDCFNLYGLNSEGISAESVLESASESNKKFIARYLNKDYVKKLSQNDKYFRFALHVFGPNLFRKIVHNQIKRLGRRK